MPVKSNNPATKAIHGGYRSDPTTKAVAVPIYNSTAYEFDSADHAAKLFALEEVGNIYTRIGSPTCNIFEERMTELDGGVAALSTASGHSAVAYSVLNLCQVGDNIVSSRNLYGGTWNLFSNTLKLMGIEVRFAETDTPDDFAKVTDKKTKCYFGETLPNPKLEVFPIKQIAKEAHKQGLPLIVDNTCSPIICDSFALGADIAVYSATKYIGGHGSALGGIIVDSGNFNWENHKERFPLLNSPDPSYHDAIWTDVAKAFKANIAYILRARLILLRDLGATLAPDSAYAFIQGMQTLSLRINKHCENALEVAKFLSTHPKVKKVIYPALATGKAKQIADETLKGGYGGLVGFEIDGDIEAGKRFINNLNMLYHVVNIGDTRSLATHPASTTHQQLSEADRIKGGITDGYFRLSIGIEHIDDIIADIKQALEKV